MEVEKYLVVTGGDGWRSVLCESLTEARACFIEMHGAEDGEEITRLGAYFDDPENWVCDGPGRFRQQLRINYEADWIEVFRVTDVRVKTVPVIYEAIDV